MFVYEKKLQYPVRIANPNPKLAAFIISQYGGPDGELGASLRYLSQRYTMPYPELKALLTDIGVEELGHLEMVGAIVHQLTRSMTEQEVKDAGYEAYFVDHTAGVYPTAASDLAFAMVCGVLLTLVGIFLTPQILVWMRTPEDVLPQSIQYFRLYFMGSLFMIVYNACMGILQAVGDSRSPLRYLIISSITNVTLDLIFVGVLKWGVNGAAIATVVSQMVSAVLCFRKLMQADGPYRLVPKRIRFELPMLKQITAQGIPSGVQNSIIAIANVVVQSNINTFGSDAMAGCGSYAKVEGFVFLPITSFAMALTTFTGQNLGAGQYERAKRGARVGFTCSTLLAELIGLTLLLVAPYAIALFNEDPAVIAIGVRQTRTEALFYFALAFAHSISAVMRGAGRAKMPMYTMLVCWCVIRVTYITLALKVWPDITTIFWAYPITWCLSCVVFLLYYLKADWVHSFQKMH